MSKKVLLLAVAILFGSQAGLAMAANPDTGPGCGLGKLAWGDYKGQKEIAPQVMMATTNGTFGSQTFGISSGTSGCTNDGKIMGEHKTTMFASLNFDALTAEMAQGQGEHLASLATLMGIPEGGHKGNNTLQWDLHADYEVFDGIAPTIELHGVHYLTDGAAAGLNVGGLDYTNLGSGNVAGSTVIWFGVGARVKLTPNWSFGAVYEHALTNVNADIMDQRVTLDFIFSW